MAVADAIKDLFPISVNGQLYGRRELHKLPDDLGAFLEALCTQTEVIVHTSGSTGPPQPYRLTVREMLLSAQRSLDFFSLQPGQSVACPLPFGSIATRMMILRALLGRLNYEIWPARTNPLDTAPLRPVQFAAFTPMQVYEILQRPDSATEYGRITQVIIGGGAIPATLLNLLSACSNDNYSTYGMTETASHIAIARIKTGGLKYRPVPGVSVAQDVRDRLTVVMPREKKTVVTNDLVQLHPDGSFQISGRADWRINSGGLKFSIEAIETLLEQSGVFSSFSFFIYPTPHPKYGEVITMFTTDSRRDDLTPLIASACPDSRMRPKKWIRLDRIIRTATGKIDRRASANESRRIEEKMLDYSD